MANIVRTHDGYTVQTADGETEIGAKILAAQLSTLLAEEWTVSELTPAATTTGGGATVGAAAGAAGGIVIQPTQHPEP